MFKKIASILLAIILTFAVMPITAMADVGDHQYTEVEKNNSAATANLLYSDYTVSGTLSIYDLDYFKFTLTSTAEVTFMCQSSSYSIMTGIQNSSGHYIETSDSSYYEGYYYNYITTTLTAGTYYLVIMSSQTSYTCSYLYYFEHQYSSTTHSHSYTSKVTSPTCTAQGYTTHTCSCGDSYKSNYTSAKGHSYTSKVTAPTCVSQGYTTYTCSFCGDNYKSNYTAKTDHTGGTPVKENVVNATCVSGGTYDNAVYCSVCGEWLYSQIVDTPINANAHTFDNLDDMYCNDCGKERPPYILGDINNDSVINNKDLGLLMQHLNDWAVEIVVDAADVNGDGKVNNKDYGLLMQYLNEWDVQLGASSSGSSGTGGNTSGGTTGDTSTGTALSDWTVSELALLKSNTEIMDAQGTDLIVSSSTASVFISSGFTSMAATDVATANACTNKIYNALLTIKPIVEANKDLSWVDIDGTVYYLKENFDKAWEYVNAMRDKNFSVNSSAAIAEEYANLAQELNFYCMVINDIAQSY